MRLFLLPLSVRRSFIYCDKNYGLAPKNLVTAGSTASSKSSNTASSPSTASTEVSDGQASAQTYIDKLTTKAATTWSDWERAEGGWKLKLTHYGNKALRRIPYEEWGLKSFPPMTDARKEDGLAQLRTKPVAVLFPSSLLKQGDVDGTLLTLAQERQAMHKKRMWYCLVGAPLTLPCALVPIVPNIPGFYLLFRAWSHYRALYGAQYLQFLVENKLYKATPSTQLDKVYAKIEQRSGTGEEKDTVLLSKEGGKELAQVLNSTELGIELERAVEQVENAVLKTDATKEASERKEQ